MALRANEQRSARLFAKSVASKRAKSLRVAAMLENGCEQSLTNPQHETTSYTYDPAGRVFRQIDRAGFVTEMTYDAAGQQLTVKNPLGSVSSTVYDEVGQVIEQIDPLGKP